MVETFVGFINILLLSSEKFMLKPLSNWATLSSKEGVPAESFLPREPLGKFQKSMECEMEFRWLVMAFKGFVMTSL